MDIACLIFKRVVQLKAEGYFNTYYEQFMDKFKLMLDDLEQIKGDPFEKVFDLVQKDKQFMNEVIDYFSQNKCCFPVMFLTYVIENYEPGYQKFLDNLFRDSSIVEGILYQNLPNEKILGQIKSHDGYDYALTYQHDVSWDIIDEKVILKHQLIEKPFWKKIL